MCWKHPRDIHRGERAGGGAVMKQEINTPLVYQYRYVYCGFTLNRERDGPRDKTKEKEKKKRKGKKREEKKTIQKGVRDCVVTALSFSSRACNFA